MKAYLYPCDNLGIMDGKYLDDDCNLLMHHALQPSSRYLIRCQDYPHLVDVPAEIIYLVPQNKKKLIPFLLKHSVEPYRATPRIKYKAYVRPIIKINLYNQKAYNEFFTRAKIKQFILHETY